MCSFPTLRTEQLTEPRNSRSLATTIFFKIINYANPGWFLECQIKKKRKEKNWEKTSLSVLCEGSSLSRGKKLKNEPTILRKIKQNAKFYQTCCFQWKLANEKLVQEPMKTGSEWAQKLSFAGKVCKVAIIYMFKELKKNFFFKEKKKKEG